MLDDKGDFPNQAAAIRHAKAMARDLVWHPELKTGSILLVVDEAGETIAELPLVKPPH
jgi:hypothetical protein